MLRAIFGLLLCPLLFFPARAEDVTSIRTERERLEATSGNGYTVIGRAFLGEDGNVSYLRFLNLSGTSATVTSKLIGSPSGKDYGSVTVTIPDNASRQISISELLSGKLTDPDTRLAIYLRSTNAPVAVQHVLYNAQNGFFENLSNCQNSSLSDGNSALVNVHTSRIPDYTSYITIHNYSDNAATYDVSVYESEKGLPRGSVPVTIEPNATFEQPFSYFEDQLSWSPGESVFHANMTVFPRAGTRNALVSHIVFNSKLSAYLNLTTFCTVATTANTLPVAVEDNISGAIVGQSYTITLPTLVANDQNASGAALLEATAARTNGSTNGTLVQTGNTITFTPAQRGIARFEYRIRTSAGDSNFATVTVNIGGGTPAANADTLTQQFSIGKPSLIVLSTLTANDTDATGAVLEEFTVPTTNNSINGTMSKTDGGNLLYTPATNGTATFTYSIRTTAGKSDAANVTLQVGDQTRPIANNDSLTGACTVGKAFTITLSSLTRNDENATGATLRDFTAPRTGSLTGEKNGTLTQSGNDLSYVLGSPGTVAFQYRIANNAGESNFATVTLNCDTKPPVAVDDTLQRTFPVGQPTTFGLSALIENDQNAIGASLESVGTPLTSGAINGTVTKSGNDITVTPAREGSVTFTYTIRTNAGLSNNANVTLNAGGNTTAAPVAVDDKLDQVFAVGTQSTISLSTLASNDRNAVGASLVSVGTPTTDGTANGTITTSGDRIFYSPSRDGRVTFDYTISTSAGRSTAKVSLSVVATGPTAVSDTLTGTFSVGQQSTIKLATLTSNDLNASGASLDTVGTPTTDGSTNGTIGRSGSDILYTPARAGTVTFEYRIRTSAGQSNSATVRLTVTASTVTRSAPIAVADSLTQSFKVGETTTFALSVLTANDLNTEGVIFENIGTPTTNGASNGTLIRIEGGMISYKPERAGTVTFDYRLRNSAGTSNTATVTLTVRSES